MNIIDCFKPQMEIPHVVTKEIYSQLKNKEYYNGRKVKIGDNMLYALMVENKEYKAIDYTQNPPIEREEPAQSIIMTLIVLHPDNIKDFEPFKGYDNSKTADRLPIISKINNDGK